HSRRLEGPDADLGRDQHDVGHLQEQSVADDAGDARDPAREFHGPPDRPEVRIEEVVPVVRSEGLLAILPQFDLRAERLQPRARVLPAEWMALDEHPRPPGSAPDALR